MKSNLKWVMYGLLGAWLLAGRPVVAEEGLYPLRELDFMGAGSTVSLNHRDGMSPVITAGSDKGKQKSLTLFVTPGETPYAVFNCYYDKKTAQKAYPGGNAMEIAVDGGTWAGKKENADSKTRDWKVPVQPGWNEVTVRVKVFKNRISGQNTDYLGELTQRFKIFAYIFDVQPAFKLEDPLPGQARSYFLEYPITDAAGNIYLCARKHYDTSKSEQALVRFDPGGRITARYEIHPEVGALPWAVDDEGQLYAEVMDNLVKFDAKGRFIASIAAFGTTSSKVTREHLINKDYPSSDGERKDVLGQVRPCLSNNERAVIDDKMYFIAEAADSKACGQHHVLVCLTMDGRAEILGDINAGSGVIAYGGNLYVQESAKQADNGILVFSSTGRLIKQIKGLGNNRISFDGIDGAGYFYFGACTSEPSLALRASADLSRARFRSTKLSSESNYGKNQPTDLLTGQSVPSNHNPRTYNFWMHQGALYVVYETDMMVSKITSRQPGAAGGGSSASGLKGGKKSLLSFSLFGKGEDQDSVAEPSGADDGQEVPAPVTPGQAAGATAAAGFLAVLGSLLFSRAMGVDLSSVKEAVDTLLSMAGQSVSTPPPPPQPEVHSDGEVNAQGEVYSENSGWVSRADYEKDVATRRLIDKVNAGVNARPDAVTQDLGRAWTESQRKLDDMREASKYIELSTQLAEKFGTDAEKAWCLDFINRHAKAGANGYEMDPETARQMYAGLKKQMHTAGQIANQAEAEFQQAAADELGKKGEVAAQIRDNATRVNRVLAKFDPTGTGEKIVGFQQGVYGAIDGYETGGLAGAAEAAALTVADNYTQGYASGNYNALKEAYAEQGLSEQSIAERLAQANLETANNKYNALDHAGKAADHLLEGNLGAAVDSTLDAVDAKDALKDDYGKARDWATGAKAQTPDKAQAPQADSVPDAQPDAGKKSLGTMRRESFDETRRSMDSEIQMMQELNRIADIPDAAQRQAELVRVRNSDPSTFNVVQKQLHTDTARAVTETNKVLSDQVVERQAQILKDMGYDPEVRLTGKAGGADTDGFWNLKDGEGRVLSDGRTREVAGQALKQASDEVLQPLGTDADQMGHKIMNDSPEKFSADPNDLGIKSRDGRLENGGLVFEEHARSGDHWTDDPRKAAVTAPRDRIADAAMTCDNAESLGEVLKTKTAHLDEIARNKGAVSESDMRDLARELTKTNHRTFLPMADKAGVKPTAEYRDLMQKLMLVKDGEISSQQLPPRSDIDRIIAENVGLLKAAIQGPT
jgi:hypothetical protein